MAGVEVGLALLLLLLLLVVVVVVVSSACCLVSPVHAPAQPSPACKVTTI
jgi:hypothetical protein